MKTSTTAETAHDTPEGLRRCQVETPDKLVKRVWEMALELRGDFYRVLDLGAGDGRFSVGGSYTEYVGIEIDDTRPKRLDMPRKAAIINCCASTAPDAFDLTIGNPPYTKHQDIDPAWRERLRKQIHDETGHEVSRFGNLYLYFMWLSLLKTKDDGLVALIVPFEWVSRPSAQSLREYLRQHGYRADVYRLPDDNRLFPGVKTTASITIIDKAARKHEIRCHRMDANLRDIEPNGFNINALPYEEASAARAFRGFSSGSQEVFLLTEDERRSKQIKENEVVACVASLRGLPAELTTLNATSFKKHYIDAGRKCWLLRTDGELSPAMKMHLFQAPLSIKSNWTCSHRNPWYAYALPPVPDLVYSSGFRGSSPRVFINSVGARVSGAAHGISLAPGQAKRTTRQFIENYSFGNELVPHARGLRKIEVRQMNAVLNKIIKGVSVHGASR